MDLDLCLVKWLDIVHWIVFRSFPLRISVSYPVQVKNIQFPESTMAHVLEMPTSYVKSCPGFTYYSWSVGSACAANAQNQPVCQSGSGGACSVLWASFRLDSLPFHSSLAPQYQLSQNDNFGILSDFSNCSQKQLWFARNFSNKDKSRNSLINFLK